MTKFATIYDAKTSTGADQFEMEALINRHEADLGFSLIGVGSKPAQCYVKYVEKALERNVIAFHLLALGDAWITKARQIASRLVATGATAEFHEDVGEEKVGGAVFPALVITLVAKTAGWPRDTTSEGSDHAQP